MRLKISILNDRYSVSSVYVEGKSLLLYLRPHGVVAGGILFYCWCFFLSPFAKGSPRWCYRQGTFLTQMVGYRCNFKNWVQNWGGATPIKIWGPQTPNVVTQSRRTWSKHFLGISHENEYPKLVSKFLGPPKNLRGSKFRNFDIETGLAQGSRVTLTSNFYKW